MPALEMGARREIARAWCVLKQEHSNWFVASVSRDSRRTAARQIRQARVGDTLGRCMDEIGVIDRNGTKALAPALPARDREGLRFHLDVARLTAVSQSR